MSERLEAQLKDFEGWQRELVEREPVSLSGRSRAEQADFWANLPDDMGYDLRRAEHGLTLSKRGLGRFLGWIIVTALVLAAAAGFWYRFTRPVTSLEFIPASQPATPTAPVEPCWQGPAVARTQA